MRAFVRAKTQKEKEEEEDFKKKMTKGAILLLTGVPKDTRHEKLKEEFNKYGTCSWVDLYPDKEEVSCRNTHRNLSFVQKSQFGVKSAFR